MKSVISLVFLATQGVNSFAPATSAKPLVRGGKPLQPNFLKELGLEKPSWLPDFGGGDKKEEPAPAPAEEGEEGEDSDETKED